MEQTAYVSSNNSLSSSVKHEQHSSQTRVQNIDMLTFNTTNSNNDTSINVSIAEPVGNTFTIASGNVLDQNVCGLNQNSNSGDIKREKFGKHPKTQQPKKPPPTIETFWPTMLQEVQNAVIDSKHQSLPLARIKKIMKLDENAKMIAAEAPTLFAKACEFFIQELTMRAWIHTDESKRRTLQRSDIAQAIANYDQFDFLIDIVPREDIKPPSHRRHHNENSSTTGHNASPVTNTSATSNMNPTVSNMVTGEIFNVTGLPVENLSTATAANSQPTTAATAGGVNQAQPTQILSTGTTHHTPQLQIIQQTAHPQQHLQYYITLPGHQSSAQTQLVHQLQLQQQQQQQHLNNSLNLVAQQPQQLILTTANPNGAQSANVVQHQTALLQNIAQHQQQHPQQQVQLLQHVMLTPNGEITNMPVAINANQLNLLRLQMQQQQQQQQHQQQIIIPTHLLTAQQLLQLQAHTQNQNQVSTGTTAHIIHHQPHQQQQHQQPQTPTTTNNIYIHANSAVSNQASAAGAASMVSTDRNMGSTFRSNC